MLGDDCLFDFGRFFSQVLEDLSFLLDSSILFSFQVSEVFGHLLLNRGQLFVKGLNAIRALLVEQVFQMCHPVVPSLVLRLLVIVLLIELVVHLLVKVLELLIVFDRVCLERVINFFALVNSVLLDVFDFSKRIGERLQKGWFGTDC